MTEWDDLESQGNTQGWKGINSNHPSEGRHEDDGVWKEVRVQRLIQRETE